MSKLTIDQKRLETLRRQLYGKEKDTDFKSAKKSVLRTTPASTTTLKTPLSTSTTDIKPTHTSTEDTNYLKKDLTKVAILSITAIAIQLILYFTPLKSVLNIKIF